MTNGLVVSNYDILGRDYWYNGTCCSGYSFRDGSTTEHCLKAFKFGIEDNPAMRGWDTDTFLEYSPTQTLVVPEQLVWWKNE